MKFKKIMKISVDIIMTAILFLSMGYAIWGELTHEIFGVALFTLFVIHHILNINWYKAILKGKYSPYRVFALILNILLTLCVTGLMVSGIMMSKHIFAFMDINNGMAFARLVHLSVSHWNFAIMSLHIGLHINPVVQKTIKKNKNFKVIFIFISILISAFGIYAFIKRDFADYMFLKTQFAFMDFNESPVVFCIEYTAIMGLFISVSHYIGKVLKSKRKSDKVI